MTQSLDIRLPDLGGGTPEEQLRQIRSYLYQLSGQLQFAMAAAPSDAPAAPAPSAVSDSPAAVFSGIKSLIIKSADIVNAYYDEINRRLDGVYVARSAFGTFAQETSQQIRENADGIRRGFDNVQRLLGDVEQVRQQLLEVNAYIKSGLLDYDGSRPVYGVEIGQQELTDGVVGFRKFVRLTADRLSFYDDGGSEVAYISDRKLHITDAETQQLRAAEASLGALQLGSYTLTPGADGHLTLA